MDFAIENIESIKKMLQIGESTLCSKRKLEDNKLNVNKTIIKQLDSMRTTDNQRYNYFFNLQNNFYYLTHLKLNEFI